MKGFGLSAALVIVALALGGFVWYFDLSAPKTPTPTAAQRPIIDVAIEQVSAVRVNDGWKSAAVERKDGAWLVTEPVQEPGDASRIEDTLGRLVRLAPMRTIDAPGDLTGYGLEAPTITIELQGSAPSLLRVGAKTPDGAAYYARLADGAAVHVIPSFAIADALRWTTDPPLPRPTPTPRPIPAP
ncbi:MAG: DUF4340 domain-containing protein [Chloroflexota bacterium]|nr:MAG: DUF4340 domain-containing protein [Chloroflexota bacterium]